MSHLAELRSQGVSLAVGVLPAPVVDRWRLTATDWFERVDSLVDEVGPWGVADRLDVRFAPPACSLGIDVVGADTVVDTLVAALGDVIEAQLGGPARALTESSWLRRQRPRASAPTWHTPHTWHQDGALGFDFADDPATGLLPMVTCWCPLVACGDDAPGIAYVPGRHDGLLTPEELGRDHGPAEAPVMGPGDVLLMTGDLLHRTHTDPAMTAERVSVEVRFVPVGHPARRGPWSG